MSIIKVDYGEIAGENINLKDFVYKYWSSHSSQESVNLGFEAKKIIFSFILYNKQYFRVYDKEDSANTVHTYIDGTDNGETSLSDSGFTITSNGITIESYPLTNLQIYAFG